MNGDTIDCKEKVDMMIQVDISYVLNINFGDKTLMFTLISSSSGYVESAVLKSVSSLLIQRTRSSNSSSILSYLRANYKQVIEVLD